MENLVEFSNIFSLKGKVAIVTGGYGHLGKAITKALYDFGADVYVAGRYEKKFKEVFNNFPNIKFVYLDILNETSIKEAFEKVFEETNSIDILVNNAVFTTFNNPEKMTEEEFIKGVDGTLISVFRCLKNAIPYMKKTGGSIINISSMYGLVAPDLRIYEEYPQFLNPPNYGAAKAGVIQLTKYYAVALSKYNIRVNCITPGAFPSKEVQKHKGFIKKLEQKIPLGRIGKPEELAGAIILLASDASSYITGQNIIVDGGWTVW